MGPEEGGAASSVGVPLAHSLIHSLTASLTHISPTAAA